MNVIKENLDRLWHRIWDKIAGYVERRREPILRAALQNIIDDIGRYGEAQIVDGRFIKMIRRQLEALRDVLPTIESITTDEVYCISCDYSLRVVDDKRKPYLKNNDAQISQVFGDLFILMQQYGIIEHGQHIVHALEDYLKKHAD